MIASIVAGIEISRSVRDGNGGIDEMAAGYSRF
jgi:hypothetical protein